MKPIWVVPAVDQARYLNYGQVLSERFGFPFRPRNGKTIRQLEEILQAALLVAHSQGCYYQKDQVKLKYHMGLAPLRLQQLGRMKKDYLLEALELQGNETIIDATFGFGADSLVIASQLRPSVGQIIGLESSLPIYCVASEGLQHYVDETGLITREICQRIQLLHQEHQDFLSRQTDASVDVVFFDPMFLQPVKGSFHLEGIRSFGNYEPLNLASIQEAIRVSRKRVVIKERRDSPFWSQWPIHHLIGGKYSNVAYGVIECEK